MQPSSDRGSSPRRYRRLGVLSVGAVLVSAVAFAAPAPRPGPMERPGSLPLERMEVRAAVLTLGAERIEAFYRSEVEPVERILAAGRGEGRELGRLALALVREAAAAGIDARVLASVLLVENPWLDPHAVSPQGAVGLMQVMPQHAGRWGCPSSDLRDPEANLCHGARIFAAYLEQKGGDLDRALLAYNGCVRGENTPDCHLYPHHVYSRAGRAAMRRWLDLR